MEKVQRWRDAFVEAGKISGYHLPNFKDEAECIKKLVDDIFPKLLQTISPLPENLVGMESQVEKVTSLLDMESNDVRYIGLWGMGGIGKTEIANVVHQRYRHRFEVDCFLGDVGKLHQKNGLIWLQEVVICKLVDERMTLTSEYEGMNILKNMLRWKKVLLILDDVNHREQLESLVGGPECFGMGGRIILTARDKHMLISHVVDNVYEVQLLSGEDALELFSRHAFKEKSPKEDFVELSIQVVKHAGGLPLALKVLGSLFYGRDIKHWSHMIDRLKQIPHKDIQGKLRLSFDGLDEDEKELFLDIAFLYNAGVTRSYDCHICVELVLRDPSRGFLIDHLIEKSLLSINILNNIVMHNMIGEMDENVIREEYGNSRIWLPEDVCDLFKGKLITKKVESLWIPEDCYFEDDVVVNYSNIFKRMQSLKILIVGGNGGMNILKNMLYRKKILLILDDVNHREQLESLFGGPEWFGMGSRIVLTARDKKLLISHVGENVYEVQLLSEDEALELFSRHAFKKKSPKEDFVELSRQVVKHAGGLPLALKVLGSSFYGRDKKHWRHMIDRLKRIPHKDILRKLSLVLMI